MIALVLALSACGGTDTPRTAAPSETAPATRSAEGPPQVHAEAGGTRVDLAPAGGCWSDDGLVVCGDPPPPTCATAGVPSLAVESAGAVSLDVGAIPRSLTLAEAGGPRRPLPAAATASWVSRAEGIALVEMDLGRRGEGAFAVCITRPG